MGEVLNNGDKETIMDTYIEPLYKLLDKVHNAPYGYIYLQGEYPWSPNTLGILYHTDRYYSVLLEDTQPDFVHSYNLQRVMQISRAEDAMLNAFNQKKQPTYEDLVACFNFHYKNSGYLDLTENP